MSTPLPPRRFPRNLATRYIAVAAIAMIASLASSAAPAAASSTHQTTVNAVREQAREIQLADEIIRRLRRLGLNFNRARLPHPYDPDGDVC